jgi:hypothetical protein
MNAIALGIESPIREYSVGDKLLLAHTSHETGKHEYGTALIAAIDGFRLCLEPLPAHELGADFKLFVVPTTPPAPYRI